MEWDFVGWGYCVGFFFIFGDFGERFREIGVLWVNWVYVGFVWLCCYGLIIVCLNLV